jgi:hypothetical protein
MLPLTSRCHHHRSLCAAATALPLLHCAPLPRFALPPPLLTSRLPLLIVLFPSILSVFMEKLVSVGEMSFALGVAFTLSFFWRFPLGMVVLSDILGEGSVIALAL